MNRLLYVTVTTIALASGGCGGGDVSVCFSTFGGCAGFLPPHADAGSDQTVAGGDSVTLDGSGSRGGSRPIATYRWRQTSGPDVAITSANEAVATFRAPDVSGTKTLRFTLTVTDTGGLADTATTTVTVDPVAAAATQVALELLNTTLLPGNVQPFWIGRCPAIVPPGASLQRAYGGLWLTAQVLASVRELPGASPSDALDAARRMRPHSGAGGDEAAVEALGFVLLERWAAVADPALGEALSKSLQDASDPRAAAGLIDGRARLEESPVLQLVAEPDPSAARAAAAAWLLSYRERCPAAAKSLAVLGAALKVVAVPE